jgi:nitric oxide synthase-interacting protein
MESSTSPNNPSRSNHVEHYHILQESSKKKKTTMCLTGSHSISLKKLYPVNFTISHENKGKTDGSRLWMCPACRKTLTNAVKLFMPRTCGHVFCKLCTEKFIKKDKMCFVCEKKCLDIDIIQLRHEGELKGSFFNYMASGTCILT